MTEIEQKKTVAMTVRILEEDWNVLREVARKVGLTPAMYTKSVIIQHLKVEEL